MTQDDFLSCMHRHAQRLADMLKEPEPGLMTWIKMMLEHLKALSDWHEGRLAAPTLTKDTHGDE